MYVYIGLATIIYIHMYVSYDNEQLKIVWDSSFNFKIVSCVLRNVFMDFSDIEFRIKLIYLIDLKTSIISLSFKN